MTKTHRNDPCPCGSGKKFKRCCGGGQDARSGLGHSQPVCQKAPHFEVARRDFQLANTLAAQGSMEQAVLHYERALSLRPDYYEARHNLGNACMALGDALAAQGKTDPAVVYYERALSIRPDFPEAHNNLGNVLRRSRPIEAVAHYQRAIALRPEFAEAHNNLALALAAQGKIDQAIIHFEHALALRSDYHAAHSNLLLTLNYLSRKEPLATYQAHLDFAARWETPLSTLLQAHANNRSPDRRLRIGYVSSDFRRHAVAYFIEPVLKNHDHDRFEIFCYSNHSQEDEVTSHLRAQADHWRRIAGIPDDAVVRQIRSDQIDILVDLNGHTGKNRLLVFARKPAPIQVTWLGYPNTTGLSAINYRLTDGFADPVGLTEHLHSEKLVRLPECFSCYQPPQDAPKVSELPAREKGYVTFGSFNRLTKIAPETMAVWARILLTISGSRLTLKNYFLGDAAIRQTVSAAFGRLGVAPERLVLLGQDQSQKAHLERYQSVDIGLDPFPYNGATTTCDALWMGVPVITMAGQTHVGRVGVSQMSNLGLPELICQTPDEYVTAAVRLANDLEHLDQLRKGLRPRMAASPMMAAQRFTSNLEDAYRAMWRELPPSS